ncbi:MAG: hypothetical protein AB7N71_10740, partial [Phycisphaerae bacterium]
MSENRDPQMTEATNDLSQGGFADGALATASDDTAAAPPARVNGQNPTAGAYSARPLMNEVRQKMAAMNEREFTLRRREFEIEQLHRNIQRSARDAAETQLQALREKLETRQQSLEQLEDEVARQRAILDERENAIDRRAHDIDLVERDLLRAREELTAAQSRLSDQREAMRQRREVERRNVVSRIELVRKQREEQETLGTALREQIAADRRELARQRSEAERDRDEIAAGTADLLARREELARSEKDLQSCLEAAEREQLEIDAIRVDLRAQRERLDADQNATTALRAQLTEQEAELQARTAKVARERDAANRARQELNEREQELDGREAELEQRNRELNAQLAAIAEREQGCAQRENEIRRTQVGLERERQELAQTLATLEARESDLNQQRDDLFELRTHVESREAEARQASAALEIERTEVDGIRVRLTQSAAELDSKRAKTDSDFAEVRRAIAREARRIEKSAESIVTAPSRWVLRSFFLAALTGAAAAFAWFVHDAPLFRSTASFSIVSDAGEFETLAPRHVMNLSSNALFDETFTNAIDRRQWSRLWQGGQVRIVSSPQDAEINVIVTDSDPTIAAQFARELSESYVAAYTALPSSAAPRSALKRQHALTQRNEWLTAELARVEAELARLATNPGSNVADELEAARTNVRAWRAEQETVLDTVRRGRARLAAALSDQFPRGVVPDATLQEALQADDMYLEDQREYAAVLTQYRGEFSAAFATPNEAIGAFDTKIREFQRIMRDQIELNPPELVAKALEDSLSEIAATTEKLDTFRETWRQVNTDFGRLDPKAPTKEILGIFERADVAARDIRQLTENLVRGIRARLDELRAIGGGSTREVVVMAVVHGEFNNLFSALADFVTALQAVDLTQNFRLDTLDRQLRTIQNRLETRPETLKRQMQVAADEQA